MRSHGRRHVWGARMSTTAMYVQQLWRYPVKSMAGEALERAELRLDGIAGDRLVVAAAPTALLRARSNHDDVPFPTRSRRTSTCRATSRAAPRPATAAARTGRCAPAALSPLRGQARAELRRPRAGHDRARGRGTATRALSAAGARRPVLAAPGGRWSRRRARRARAPCRRCGRSGRSHGG